MHSHVEQRVNKLYPSEIYTDLHGAVPPELRAMAQSQATAEKEKTGASASETAYEMKQSTMPDIEDTVDKVFTCARPTLVVSEATTEDALDKNTAVEHAIGSVNNMTLEMSNKFENQYISNYMPRIFPWALNYDCGGADYPDLFASYDENEPSSRKDAVRNIWRRVADEAVVTPGIYKQMLATRPEKQIAGDWLLVPAAQNLHWRWMVLKSAFLTCKQKVKPGASLSENLEALVEAAATLWARMKIGNVKISGKTRPMNGEVAMLFKDDTLNSTERILLRSYFNTTNNIAGCQALRKKIGHILFGFRIVYGANPIFVTWSPNRRHSGLLYKLQRVRRNDTGVTGPDEISKQRKKWCGPEEPPIFVQGNVTSTEDVETVCGHLDFPNIRCRQGMNAQDPISSVHYYIICMYVLLPGVFGLRMCLNCPHCNCEKHDPLRKHAQQSGCQDNMGRNSKPLGGFAGLAEALAFATELQGDGTLHGHGFIALANAWQYGSLQDIGNRIAEYAATLNKEDVMSRLNAFITHLSREDHIDDAQHQASLDSLEQQFKCNNDGPRENIFLSCRSRCFYDKCATPSLWDRNATDNTELVAQVQKEAAEFKKQYDADVQFVFSRVQHHWHPKNKKGDREAPKYCKNKAKSCTQCKRGFPKKVLCDKFQKIREDRYRVRVVCKGVAAEMHLPVSGRRNMLGCVLGKRRCPWFAPTSSILSLVCRSNTNVQTNYRMPLTDHTHDRDCNKKDCMTKDNNRKILLLCQRAMSQMSGYFGGYISKKQKVGQFEIKRSIEALPLLKEKLQEKASITASTQLAHVCNRFFSVLESKGILRTSTEEFLLASRYRPDDELNAEFIRTFHHRGFTGMAYLQKYEQSKGKKSKESHNIKIPATKTISAEFDEVALCLHPTKYISLFHLMVSAGSENNPEYFSIRPAVMLAANITRSPCVLVPAMCCATGITERSGTKLSLRRKSLPAMVRI